ncbi:hypothetical protein [Plantibacter sp. YIM 135347]|uniref:hypothetical protein n=1 Tax=Plantibacter sp. YIM 135347 TaxID=3423919 RepID=UPI003D353003
MTASTTSHPAVAGAPLVGARTHARSDLRPDAGAGDRLGSRLRRFGRRPAFAAALVAGIALAAAGVPLSVPAPAHAAGSVTTHVVDRPDLQNVADPNYLTQVQVTGSEFQSIVNGHGGIYVLFGWAEPGESWKPSNGGTTGGEYRYVPDDETNPTGYALFVAFPGGDTSYAANGGEVDAAGNWSGVISIPGSTFQAFDRSGNATTVDCRQVQCGIITIGAHGVKNANNESFTPITFTDLYSGDANAQVAAPPAPAAAPVSTPEPTIVSSTIVAKPNELAAASATDDLVPLLTGAIIGVGALAIGAVAFLVWAVVSGRKRAAKAELVAAGAGAATGSGAGAGSGTTTAGTPPDESPSIDQPSGDASR